MISFFQIVKKVLDAAYLEMSDPNKDLVISQKLLELSDHYKSVLDHGGPSYAHEATRFGYAFRYTTAHADYLNSVINWAPEIRKKLQQDQANITCIGGGPGSDVLGFVKYILAADENPKLTFYILDKEQSWVETWGDLDAIVSEEVTTSRNFLNIDVTDSTSYEALKKPFAAEIFTLIYFLSEIYKLKKAANEFLKHCFSKMKSGAVVVVIDFEDTRLQEWIDAVAEECGLSDVLSHEQRLVVGGDEQASDLQEYKTKFGYPKLQAQMMFRVYQKG